MLQAETGNKPQMLQTKQPETKMRMYIYNAKSMYNFKGSKFVDHSAKNWLGNFFYAGFVT